jgi:arabinose-5-phosphate isomerase
MMSASTDGPDRGDQAILAEGVRVLREEGEAVLARAGRLGAPFVSAVRLLAGARGRVIVSGVGKSGIIGRKIAATLTSTGTPATFLHPVEGMHGDLGIVSRDDVALLISRSGDTVELTGLLDFLVRFGVPIVALTSRPDSILARHATLVLETGTDPEACPMGLAPTTSTTVTVALGDALAVALLQHKGFRAEDFAHLHPGGALGRKLSLRVSEVMVSEGIGRVGPGASMRDCIIPLARMRGTVTVVDADGHVAGVITAGDLTRLMQARADFLDVPVSEAMTRNPRTAAPDELAAAAVHRMEMHGIMALPVVAADGRLAGMVHLHDLLRAGAA